MSERRSEFVYLDRETSWLRFGSRVLQEAADPTVPAFERLFFCGIFSSNLDEYFRVRVASLRALLRLGKADRSRLGIDPYRLLHDIHRIVLEQQERYGRILGPLFDELASEGVQRVDERTADPEHHEFLKKVFDESVRPCLETNELVGDQRPFLENHAVYLVVERWPLHHEALKPRSPSYILVNVPSGELGRFTTLPGRGDASQVMLLDDVIRFNLDRLFPAHEVGRSFAIKLTRDAELYVEDEFEVDLVEAIRKSLKKRETGLPSRLLYDSGTPYALLRLLQERLGLTEEDFVQGARYHNLNDYMGFPRFGRADLSYPEWPALPHPVFDRTESVMDAVRERDQIIHTPYQSFTHFVRLLEEAAVADDVEEVWLTVYRVASDSSVLNALIRAAENGKKVTVFMEVQARFDEQTNLHWADRLEAAGVRTLFSMRGLKVHAKIALIRSRTGPALAYVGTGNFNEKSAKAYTDHGIFTCDERITDDVDQVFRFLAGEVEEPETKHLLVAPFTMRKSFNRLIAHEAEKAAVGEPSGMTLKMNALEDGKIIERLYEASVAGVPIDIIVRGICRLVPGLAGQSETIRIRSILDRYLEHPRVYRFHHDGEDRMYLASADWMTRNLSHRVEVAIPVYDPGVRTQLDRMLELQLADNQKARVIDAEGLNPYAGTDGPLVRAQEDFRAYLEGLA